MEKEFFDYIIIGAGAAGLASAQYATRSGLKTLVIDISVPGGQALEIPELENYPGVFPSVNGIDFISTMQKQAEFFGAKIIQSEVNSIDKIAEKFIVHTKNIEYSSYCLLIATGAEHKKLGVTGETEFYGRGVSYCAVCDGPFFRNKDVVVIGGGDSAINEALYLSSIAKNVTVIHRRNKFRAAQSTVDRIKQKDNVTLMYDSVVKEIVGSSVVTGVVTENVETKVISEVKTDAVFVFVGMSPKTGLVSTLNKDNSGYIITDDKMQTNVPGLFCAGDVRSKPLRQIVTAVSDGAIAAHSVEEYIQTLNK